MFAWELGVQVPGLTSHQSWGRVLGGSGPGRRWRTLKAVLKVTRSTAGMTILVTGRRLSLEAEWLLGLSQVGAGSPWAGHFLFSGCGFLLSDGIKVLRGAPQMLSLMPGTWGPLVLLCWIVWFFLCFWKL